MSTHDNYDEAVDFIVELDDQAPLVSGGAEANGISTWLGNQGRFCTLTDECMPTC